MRGWALYYGPVTKWPDAALAFEKALQLDPQSIGARIGLATVLVVNVNRGVSKSRGQDLARAEKLALEAVERVPNSAPAYFALGVTHRAQNRLPESRAELEKAIAIDRNHAGAILQLGITLLFPASRKPPCSISSKRCDQPQECRTSIFSIIGSVTIIY